jgi:hypothetical protein
MPINPGQKETEDEFIGRCMSEETGNYESDQAYAICKSKWDNAEEMSKNQERFKTLKGLIKSTKR